MGPLAGVRVVELAGAGPTPFAGMLLSDMGADVIRVDPREERAVNGIRRSDLLGRNRRSVAIDLHRPEGVECVLRLVEHSDALLEGFRPGIAERLGVGPDACLARNRRLVYARGTGWGQAGPLRDRAGHDVNYIAVAGALYPIGPPDRPPVPPLSLVGDFGGGGALVAFGVVCALLSARTSGVGQVVDAAMVDGAALLTTVFHELRATGQWTDARGQNLVDGGAPFYGTYETADGRFVAVGAIEPQFFTALADLLGLDAEQRAWYADPWSWPQLRQALAEAFRRRDRDEWCHAAETTDACVTPVLSLAEVAEHRYNAPRNLFVPVGDVLQPAPAPRLSRTPAARPRPAPRPGQHTEEVLVAVGYSPEQVARLAADCVVGPSGTPK